MSEPNMGLVVLGPVLGPADNACSASSHQRAQVRAKILPRNEELQVMEEGRNDAEEHKRQS